MAKTPALPGQRAARIAALKKHLRSLLIGVGIGVACGLLVVLIATPKEGFIARTELLSLDVRYRTRPRIPAHPEVGLIDYDDASLALFGGWPWPRHRQVALVRMLDFYDARAAGYDVFFSEKNDIVLMEDRIRKFVEDTSITQTRVPQAQITRTLQTSIRDYDHELERAISSAGNIYLGYFVQQPDKTVAIGGLPAIKKYVEEDKKSASYPREAMEVAEQYSIPASPELERSIFKMSRMVPPLPFLTRSSNGIGFAQIVQDLDHTVRLYPMFMYYDGRIRPSIGVIMLSKILQVPFDSWVIQPDKKYTEIPNALVPGEALPETIHIPVNENGQMLMNWAAGFEEVFLHVPFWTISEYYAYHTAKNIARTFPPDPASLSALHREIMSSIDEEQMVTEEKSSRIATEIAIAHVATPLLKAGKSVSEIQAILKLPPDMPAQDAGEVIRAVQMAIGAGVSSGAGFDSAWKKEIERNVAWFTAKNRLADVEPLFFPRTHQVVWNGKQTDFSPLDCRRRGNYSCQRPG